MAFYEYQKTFDDYKHLVVIEAKTHDEAKDIFRTTCGNLEEDVFGAGWEWMANYPSLSWTYDMLSKYDKMRVFIYHSNGEEDKIVKQRNRVVK